MELNDETFLDLQQRVYIWLSWVKDLQQSNRFSVVTECYTLTNFVYDGQGHHKCTRVLRDHEKFLVTH